MFISPLRIFDCKNAECRESAACAPDVTETLCKECMDHFAEFEEYIKKAGIPYKKQTGLVRGLDYYTRTAFEITAGGLGAQNSVAGGGRYDNLVEEVGGPPTPAIGFAIGVERLVSILNIKKDFENNPTVFIAALGERAEKEAVLIIDKLRSKSIASERDYDPKSLKSQMRKADKSGAEYVLILGDNEIEKGEILLKNMKDGTQEEIAIKGIEDYIYNKLKK